MMYKTFAIAALALFGNSAYANAAEPAHWQVFTDKSQISWTASYAGKPITGTLPISFADIVFDPDQLGSSRATVKIGVAHVHSDDKDAQETLPTKEWFSVADFPEASFVSTTFTKAPDHYTMQGTLTMRGKPAQETVPFTITYGPDNTAHIVAQTTLKRLDFGIGQGDWEKTDMVADEVQVKITLEAKRISQ